MLILNLNNKRQIVASVLPITIVVSLVFLSYTQLFANHNRPFSAAVTIDLVFSVPLIHFVLSRRNDFLKYSTTFFFTAGLIVASLIIPKDNQLLLHEIKFWIVPVVELSSIAFFVIQIKKIRSKHTELMLGSEDFYTVLKKVSKELMPLRLASIITAEISVFHYGFFNWRRVAYDHETFSYHKKTGTITLIAVFIFMLFLETSIVHLVLAKWSVKAAWLVSGVSLYAALQAFGIARSVIKRPIKISSHQLIIPYGILAETAFNLEDIISVELYKECGTSIENLISISPLKNIEGSNVILRLSKTHHIEGLYGSKKAFDKLLINVDDQSTFINQLRLLTQSSGL